MRTMCVMAAILAAWAVQAAGGNPDFPSGTFAGTASWRGPGDTSGSYAVEKTFTGDTLHARYTWTDPQAREEKHTVRFRLEPTQPTFEVADDQGQVVGQGYCYDGACSYRATFGPVNVEESFRWSKDAMSVLGSKSGPGFSVVWTETLKLR